MRVCRLCQSNARSGLTLSDGPTFRALRLSFDIDPICVGYDGKDVWALPRALRALQTGVTILNPLHAWPIQPSYELRLAKYGARGFATAVAGLQPTQLDVLGVTKRKVTDQRGAARLLHVHLTLNNPEHRVVASEWRQHADHSPISIRLDWEATIRRTFGVPTMDVQINGGCGGGWVAESHRKTLTALPYANDQVRMLVQDPYAWIRGLWENQGHARPDRTDTHYWPRAARPDDDDTNLANFAQRCLVIADEWEGIVDAERDDLDEKLPRHLAWTTVAQSREYVNMEKPYETLCDEYWATV